MNKQRLKKNFIKYFGERKWLEEEVLNELIQFEIFVCDYLDIEPVPVVLEDMIDDSRFYIKDAYIAISTECAKDKIEAAKCLAHELRHLYQMICIASNDVDEPLRFEWEKDYKNPIVVNDRNSTEEYSNYVGMSIELDAFAFQKFIVSKYFNVSANHANADYDVILDLYINKHFI